MKSKTELEPCPFCGSGDVVLWKYSKRAKALQKAVSHAPTMIRCNGCGAMVSFDDPLVNAADMAGFTSEAVKAWNRRQS